jgi:hypothetical protein
VKALVADERRPTIPMMAAPAVNLASYDSLIGEVSRGSFTQGRGRARTHRRDRQGAVGRVAGRRGAGRRDGQPCSHTGRCVNTPSARMAAIYAGVRVGRPRVGWICAEAAAFERPRGREAGSELAARSALTRSSKAEAGS